MSDGFFRRLGERARHGGGLRPLLAPRFAPSRLEEAQPMAELSQADDPLATTDPLVERATPPGQKPRRSTPTTSRGVVATARAIARTRGEPSPLSEAPETAALLDARVTLSQPATGPGAPSISLRALAAALTEPQPGDFDGSPPATSTLASARRASRPGEPQAAARAGESSAAAPSLVDEPGSSSPAASTAGSSVHVHIGRIEVRASAPAPTPAARPAAARPALPLDEFLARRGPR